jgi:hypothetical protein
VSRWTNIKRRVGSILKRQPKKLPDLASELLHESHVTYQWNKQDLKPILYGPYDRYNP